MRALLLTQTGHPTAHFQLGESPKPVPDKHDVLVKVVSAALNPVDYKMAHYNFLISSLPVALGCDVSGVVESVGSEVSKFKAGDEVFGFSELGKQGSGAFAEYSILQDDLLFKKNKHTDFDVAATFPVGSLTAALGIFHHLKVPLPSQNQQAKFASHYLLVWGGASSVGNFAVQLGVLSGFKVIATASNKNFDLVKSFGAEHVFDYTSPDVVEQIQKYTSGKLHYAYDTISSDQTYKQVFDSLSKDGEAFVSGTSASKVAIPSNVHYKDTQLAATYYAPDHRVLVSQYVQELEALIDSGKLKGSVVEKLGKGLASVVEGLELLLNNKVGGKKVVVSISDTPSA